jgi:hypothetical protein
MWLSSHQVSANLDHRTTLILKDGQNDATTRRDEKTLRAQPAARGH